MTYSKLFLVLVALALAYDTAPGQRPAPPISGVVYSSQRGALGGVTISLVHPLIGRSGPAFSAPNGAYFFANVPPQIQPYYIEAYWGSQLLFRGQLVYQGAPVQFDIGLP